MATMARETIVMAIIGRKESSAILELAVLDGVGRKVGTIGFCSFIVMEYWNCLWWQQCWIQATAEKPSVSVRSVRRGLDVAVRWINVISIGLKDSREIGPRTAGPRTFGPQTTVWFLEADIDLHTFVEKMSRVAFTHFYGGQPNLSSALILGNFWDGNQNIKGLITFHLYGDFISKNRCITPWIIWNNHLLFR